MGIKELILRPRADNEQQGMEDVFADYGPNDILLTQGHGDKKHIQGDDGGILLTAGIEKAITGGKGSIGLLFLGSCQGATLAKDLVDKKLVKVSVGHVGNAVKKGTGLGAIAGAQRDFMKELLAGGTFKEALIEAKKIEPQLRMDFSKGSGLDRNSKLSDL